MKGKPEAMVSDESECQSRQEGETETIKLYNCVRINSEIYVQYNAGISKYSQWKEQI